MQLIDYNGKIVLCKGASEFEILAFEKEINLPLPIELKEFLLQSNGCGILHQYIVLDSNSFELCISLFSIEEMKYANANIKRIEEEFHYYFSDVLLPIGDPGGPRYLCIGTKDEYKDKIYIIHYQDYDYQNLESMLTYIAPSLESLFQRLVPEYGE